MVFCGQLRLRLDQQQEPARRKAFCEQLRLVLDQRQELV
jgi:hypothetical protein